MTGPGYWPGHSHTRGPCSLGYTVKAAQPGETAQWGGRRCDDPRRSLAAPGGEMADARQTLQPTRTSTCHPERGWPGQAAGSRHPGRDRRLKQLPPSLPPPRSKGPRGSRPPPRPAVRLYLTPRSISKRAWVLRVCLATEGSLAGQGPPPSLAPLHTHTPGLMLRGRNTEVIRKEAERSQKWQPPLPLPSPQGLIPRPKLQRPGNTF